MSLTGVNGNVTIAMTTLTMQDEKSLEVIQRGFRGELAAAGAAVVVEQMQVAGFCFQTFLLFVSFILPQALSNLTPQRRGRCRGTEGQFWRESRGQGP